MRKPFLRAIAGLTAAAFTATTLAQTVPVSNYGYDTASQLTSATEPNGQAHVFQYNAFGELGVHQQPNPGGTGTAGQVSYGYNGQGALVSVTDPRGLVTSYSRDGLGSTQTLTSPDTGVTNSVFDEAGNRTSYTDARGVTVSTDFDNLNRPTSVNYGDFSVGLGYDAGYGAGKLTSVSDASGSTAWSHDKLGRVLSKTQVTGGTTLAVGYSYYSGGRVASITYPSGMVVGFNYDGANVSSITVNGATAISGVSYFPFGAPKAWTMGSIGTYSRTADTYGRITGYTTEYGSRTLTWDASSRLTGITETGQAGRTYGYDNLNRLTTSTESTARGYGYDLTGNRTSETVNGSSFGYGVDAGSNKLTGSANDTHSRSYSLDAAGNTTSDGSKSFAYNGAGQLTQVTTSSGVIAQYAYNGFGQRVRKVTGAGARYYVYAEDGISLLGEYGAAGASVPVSESVYLDGTPVMVLQGGSAYFVLPDHLNTPRAVKNTAGATVWRWNSDAFGNGAADENPSGLFQFTFNQRLPGQQFDAETGLHYNNARYYDPAVGRYVTSDPIGLDGGLNTYLYGLGSPATNVDPSGLWVPLIVVAARVLPAIAANIYRINALGIMAAEAAAGVSYAPTLTATAAAVAVLSKGNVGKLCSLEVGTYGQQAARSVKDGLTPDHIPSFAAMRTAYIAKFGSITRRQETALRNATTTIGIPSDVHAAVSRTYKGRNTSSVIAADAADLYGAVQRDKSAYVPELLRRGYTQAEIDTAFEGIVTQQRAMGIY